MPHSKQQLERLFEDHYGLIVSQAISFCPRSQNELDDYIQVAAVGMIKAFENFDPARAKFSTYAIVCIRNHLKNHIRTERKNKILYLPDLDNKAVYMSETLFNVLPDSLSTREKKLIQMKMMGYSYREMAEELSMPIFRVKSLTYNTYRKIRKANDI